MSPLTRLKKGCAITLRISIVWEGDGFAAAEKSDGYRFAPPILQMQNNPAVGWVEAFCADNHRICASKLDITHCRYAIVYERQAKDSGPNQFGNG
jgi:hypothetical protein